MRLRHLIAIAVLLFIASASKGVCDDLQFHYSDTVFASLDNDQFWDPDISHRNKWAGGVKANGERFLGSSTIFVWVTDAWHLFQTIQYTCYRLIVTFLFAYALGYRNWTCWSHRVTSSIRWIETP